jgi:hypothetical protein
MIKGVPKMAAIRIEQDAGQNRFMVRSATRKGAIQVRVSLPEKQFATATPIEKKKLAKVLAKQALEDLLARF